MGLLLSCEDPKEFSPMGREALLEAVIRTQALKTTLNILLPNALCLPPENGNPYQELKTPPAVLHRKMENLTQFQWQFSKLMPTVIANVPRRHLSFKWKDQSGRGRFGRCVISIPENTICFEQNPIKRSSFTLEVSICFVLIFSARALVRLDHFLYLIWACSFRNGNCRGLIIAVSSLPEVPAFTIYKHSWERPCCKELRSRFILHI